jgi:hypothetical protein
MEMEKTRLDDLPELITPDILARLTSAPKHYKSRANVIRRQCADGTIPAQRIGSKWYMSRDVVLAGVLSERGKWEPKREPEIDVDTLATGLAEVLLNAFGGGRDGK